MCRFSVTAGLQRPLLHGMASYGGTEHKCTSISCSVHCYCHYYSASVKDTRYGEGVVRTANTVQRILELILSEI